VMDVSFSVAIFVFFNVVRAGCCGFPGRGCC
jgi:hypothetical protein